MVRYRKKGNVTDMAKKNTYDAGSISVLEGLRRFVSARECTSEVFHEKD